MNLYIIASGNGLFKIGVASDIKSRLAHIKSGSPVECELLMTIKYDEKSINLEKDLHNKFSSKRVRGEWFALSKDDLKSICSDKKTSDLLDEMSEWGFFKLGIFELSGNAVKAAMYRMEAAYPVGIISSFSR